MKRFVSCHDKDGTHCYLNMDHVIRVDDLGKGGLVLYLIKPTTPSTTPNAVGNVAVTNAAEAEAIRSILLQG